jgi:alpha-N-arabinofuranosidase
MSQGVYAPDISWHDGTFYLLNTCVGCGGNYVMTAHSPAGPWSDPVWLPDVDGIDTSLFFDDDGTAWIVHNAPPQGKARYEGHTAIWLQQFDAKSLKTFGPHRLLVDSGSHPERKPIWIEGPHIFKKDGTYYLIAAEGGTEEGHSEVVFRSDKVVGPYAPFEGNPILTQRDLPKDRPHPITSTGHASFVRTQSGEWWAVFLCVRPYNERDFNTGRETCMMPVRWKDGWPRITDAGQSVPWIERRPNLPQGPKASLPTSGAFTIRDDFKGPTLPLYWMMLRNPDGTWWRMSKGSLELQPRSIKLGDLGNPSLLARRQQHQNAVATTKLSFDPQSDEAEAGIVALQNDDYWYFLAVGREQGGQRVLRLRRRAGGQDPVAGTVLASAPLPGKGPVELRIEARGASYDFSWKADGSHWSKLVAGADGTILSTKKAGGFVGAMIGVYAHGEP